MTPLPWVFEPCSPEDATDPTGAPWPHAVRGRKPAGRVVYGYGHTPPAADHDAREKAQRYDAREVLGERGEVVVAKLGGVLLQPTILKAKKHYDHAPTPPASAVLFGSS